LAIKSDGTLWCWGKTANFYTLTKNSSLNATPTQVGTESDWQSCRSTSGGFYHVLMKKDGSLWALDASDHRVVKPDSKYQPVTLRKIDLHKDIADFAAGGDDIGVVLTRDGEVWTWGRVIGELSPKDYWGPKGHQAFPDSRVIIQPWQLANIDSAE
jgi:alpha-tubulin suppressor-like RCC1 family protein